MTRQFGIRICIAIIMIAGFIGFVSCDNNTKKIGVITVFQNTAQIEYKSGIYDFGKINMGSKSAEITFTIKNDGNGELLLNGTPNVDIEGTYSSSFVVDVSKTLPSLTPGASTTFTILFQPDDTDVKTARITIENNDEFKNPFTFMVTGIGTPVYQWTKTFGGNDNSIEVKSMTTDSQGNLYITGHYHRTSMDFGKDFGVSDVKNCNIGACFITKILADGSYGWTKQVDGYTSIFNNIVDSVGNVCLRGSFSGTIDFGVDFGVSDIQTSAKSSSFFMKITANGDYLWTKSLPDTNSYNSTSITCDSENNIYFANLLRGSLDFGAPFGASDVITAIDEIDSVITKIDSNGNYCWSIQLGGNQDISIYQLELDSQNNIYVAGFFNGSANFGECFGITDVKNNVGLRSFFITKITKDGNYGWTKRVSGSGYLSTTSLSSDSIGNVYVTGNFKETVKFGEDFGVSDNRSSVNPDEYDSFLMRVNSDSSYGWVKHFGCDKGVRECAAIVDNQDNVYFSGSFGDTMNFGMDFGINDFNQETGSTGKTFLTKIKQDGSYCWSKCVEDSVGKAEFSALTIDNANNIFIGGLFNYTVDFGKPFNASDPKTAANAMYIGDVYVMKLKS